MWGVFRFSSSSHHPLKTTKEFRLLVRTAELGREVWGDGKENRFGKETYVRCGGGTFARPEFVIGFEAGIGCFFGPL